MSLAQVEVFNKKRKVPKQFDNEVLASMLSGASGPPSDSQRNGPVPIKEPTPTASEPRKLKRYWLEKKAPKVPSASTSEYRIYTSESRMWHALTGHGPDIKRIPPMQFACLSIIATRRQQGILQTELTKISDQDKRSVPHRTDLLAKHGYIEKRVILSNKTRTSILYAKRFAPKSAFIPQVSLAGQTAAEENQNRGGNMVDYLSLFDNVTKFLKEPKIMPLIDLKKKLVKICPEFLIFIANLF